MDMEIGYESVSYRPGESIACSRHERPTIICPYHQHPEYEIAWILRSRGRVLVGDSLSAFDEGDLFFLGAGLPHIFWNDKSTTDSLTIVIQFTREAFGKDFFETPELLEIKRLLDRSCRGLRWDTGQHKSLHRMLMDVMKSEGADRMIVFLNLLRLMARTPPVEQLSSIAYEDELSGKDSARMQKVARYVREHLYEEISQTKVAGLVGMSVPNFRRFFHRTTRRTFPRFINELRISEVCRQLATTDDTVSEVLFRCGYRNQANFYRRFHQIKGMTPEAFRKSLPTALPD